MGVPWKSRLVTPLWRRVQAVWWENCHVQLRERCTKSAKERVDLWSRSDPTSISWICRVQPWLEVEAKTRVRLWTTSSTSSHLLTFLQERPTTALYIMESSEKLGKIILDVYEAHLPTRGGHSIVKLNTTCVKTKSTFSKLHHRNELKFYQIFFTVSIT